MHSTRRSVALVLAVIALGSALAGCGAAPGEPGSEDAPTIALLLPESTVPRYEGKDKPYFEAALKDLCPDCTFLYANADSDAAKQQQQAQSMLTQGADVLVVDPYDSVAAASIVEAATAQGVPVISYDRAIDSDQVAFAVSNSYFDIGALQAQALLDRLADEGVTPDDGGLLMLNGASTDNNGVNIAKGADSVLDDSGFEILASIQTWDPAEAQSWTSGQYTLFGSKVVGIYSANDGNASGAIAAWKAEGVPVPPITGLDATIEALHYLLTGDQYMSVYNSFQNEAQAAAEAAYALATGETPEATGEANGIPAVLLSGTVVTVDNIADTVLADDFYTFDEVCGGDYADACEAAGIK